MLVTEAHIDWKWGDGVSMIFQNSWYRLSGCKFQGGHSSKGPLFLGIIFLLFKKCFLKFYRIVPFLNPLFGACSVRKILSPFFSFFQLFILSSFFHYLHFSDVYFYIQQMWLWINYSIQTTFLWLFRHLTAFRSSFEYVSSAIGSKFEFYRN